MSLVFRASLKERDFDVSFEVETGSHVAILGANGAGKSTLLQILAGTLMPDDGFCELDGRTLFDLGERNREWIEPSKRDVGVLSQSPLLFPHMTAADNVAFGLRARGMRRAEAKGAAFEWLEVTDCEQFASRKPRSLSGGQAQRVALARTLATKPSMVLLDEPMAPVDATAAPLLRRTLNNVLADKTTLIVTHDVLDALLLSEYAIVLEEGRVAQSGPTQQVLNQPKTPFTATLAGVNLIEGKWEGGSVVTGRRDVQLHAATYPEDVDEGAQVAVTFSPSSVSVYNELTSGSPRNAINVTITRLEPSESAIRVDGRAEGGTEMSALVTAGAAAELGLRPGTSAWFVVKATALTVFAL